MRLACYRGAGAIAIGLLILASLVTVGLLAAAPTPSAHAPGPVAAMAGPTTPAAPAPSAPVHPDQPVPSITISTPITSYTLLPFTVSVVIGLTGDGLTPGNFTGAPAQNATVWLSIADSVNDQFCSSISDNSTVISGQVNYTFVLNAVLLSRTPCTGITTDPMNLTASFFFTTNPSNASAVNATASASALTSLIFAPLSATLLSPSGGVGIGNTTFVASYVAQYLTSVRLLVWNPSKSTVLENASLQWPTSSVPASVTWYAPAAGLYPYTLTVTTLYGTYVNSGNVSVVQPGGGTVFYNSSVYHNSTILAGLKGPEAGTLLLVVGLVIGMIVALAVASAMRRDQPSSAQPWQSGQQGQSTAAPNTCSVCGKSFNSADELAAHMKSEHGMS